MFSFIIFSNYLPINVDIGLLAKIRKNTIPFQAKTKERNAFIRAFALVPGFANTKNDFSK